MAALRFVRDSLMGSRRGDKLLKQMLREQVIRHAFRMPLHSYNPVGIAGPLYRFDSAIRRVRSDAEFFSRPIDGLVMTAVDVRSRGTGKLCENTSVAQDRIVLLVATLRSGGKIRSSMWNGLWAIGPHIGNVLNQGALLVDVENLTAIADGQHWFRRAQSMGEDGFVGHVAVGVEIGRLRVLRSAITAWVHVRGAARQDKGVQFFQLAHKLFR